MTDKDTKTSTLKLGFGNSSPAKEVRPDVVMQKSSIRGVKKTFTVAVKKTRTINSTRSAEDSKISQEFKDVFDDKGGLTESERAARINALKSASEETPEEIKQSRKKIGLEDSLINKSTAPEVVEEPKEVIIEQPLQVEPKVEIIKQEETVTPLKKPLKVEEEETGDKNVKKVPKTDFKPPVVKNKWEEARAKPKINLGLLMSSKAEDEVESTRSRSLASIKRAREKAKRHEQRNNDEPEKFSREVIVPEVITVQELANRMAERTMDVVRELMKLGMIATANQSIDADSAELIISAFGHKIKRVSDSDVENILNYSVDLAENLKRRAPVVTVMGHVDHGKTSLLDALKSTDVAAGEAGGITQHIGAYQVTLANGEHITFLDTPGHEAFTAMRSRGAKVTDIVVLVVAADDGIMAQTVEAINHAKAANVPIIVAINKIDKEGADPNRVRTELLSHGLVAEELGGDIIVVEVSAKKRLNLEQLEESILLQAEMLDLKANFSSAASGTVIEAKIDKNRGVIATLLVQRGTLKLGDIVVAGASYGRVRAINDDKFKSISEAYPSMPVEILGLAEAPKAGEQFAVVDNEKQARDIAEFRHKRAKDIRTAVIHHGSLEELFARASSSRNKELALIIKGDVQGSVEAIAASLMKIVSSEIKVRILHAAVGGITESDISLAKASGSIIIGFNVRAGNQVREMAESEKIEIRYYSVIYDVVDDIKAAMTGMLSPVMREQYTGTVEIRRVFNISKYGKIAGCYVTQGIIKRGSKVRLLRDNIVIHEGKLKTLKRLKDDVKEVKESFECGIAIENYEDIKERDILEVFEIIEEKQTL